MGNRQCGFLSSSNLNNQFQYISQQNHLIFGEIHHVKNIQTQQHVAIKKYFFKSQKSFKEYENFIINFIHLSKNMPYVHILKIQQNDQQNKNNKKNTQITSKFNCNDNNIFKTSSQQNQFSCTGPNIKIPLTIHLKYFPYDNFCLQHIIQEKHNNFKQFIQTNKIMKNMQFDLFQKLKLNQYSKIDQLPPKQRKFINQFYTQIQILRILDSLLSGIFGTKILNISSKNIDLGIRPNLIFRNQQGKFLLLINEIIQIKSNTEITIQNIKKWYKNPDQYNQQQEIISYLHPNLFSQVILHVMLDQYNHQKQQDCKKFKISQQMMQKQNIYALGLIMIQICLFQPNICSKIYQVNNYCKKVNRQNYYENSKNDSIPQISCLPKQLQRSQIINIKLKQNLIHKYLSLIKTKYSQSLVKLIGKMIFNTQKLGYSKYQIVIRQITAMIKENVQKIKNVYGSNKNSRPDSLQKTGKYPRSSNMSPQLSSHSSSNIQTLSYTSSYSLLPLQSYQPILSFQMLKKYYQKVQKHTQNILLKQQITILSDYPLKNQQHFQQLIQKDQKRILNQLNKIQIQNSTIKNRKERFSHRKLAQKTPQQTINKINDNNKNNQESKQKRINSTTKLKQQKLKKTYQQLMLGSVSCQTIPQKVLIKQNMNSQQKKNYIQTHKHHDFRKQISSFQSSKSHLKSLIKQKNTYKNNLGQKDSQKNISNINKMNSENLYQIYMKQYQQLLEKQKPFY